MKLVFDGDDRVRVAAPAPHVREVLAEPVELLAMFGDLLDPSSRPHRWVGPELQAGPRSLVAAVDVQVATPAVERVVVRGRPVPGYTPATLDIDLVVDGDEHARLAWAWRFRIDVPGPQVLARTLRPVVTRSSRRTTREIRERLRDRFGDSELT